MEQNSGLTLRPWQTKLNVNSTMFLILQLVCANTFLYKIQNVSWTFSAVFKCGMPQNYKVCLANLFATNTAD